MVIVARPNVVGAVIQHLRSITELRTMVNSSAGWTDGRVDNPRISAAIQDKWNMPTNAIVLRASGGPYHQDEQADILLQRIDFICYGSTAREATLLWCMLDAALRPPLGVSAAFTVTVDSADCRVLNVLREGGPISDRELNTLYQRIIAVYLMKYVGVPV